jgi:chemotaxis signal transduction protein
VVILDRGQSIGIVVDRVVSVVSVDPERIEDAARWKPACGLTCCAG